MTTDNNDSSLTIWDLAKINAGKETNAQHQEDLMIEHILLTLIGEKDLTKTACEFGAADGIWLSNTHILVKNHGFDSLQIEGQSSRFEQLKANYAKFSGTTCLNAMVSPSKNDPNSITNLLLKWKGGSSQPFSLDVLSIDVDSCDYDIFESIDLNLVRPKLILVENNSFQEQHRHQGMTSITNLANARDYDLVGFSTNSFLLDRTLYKNHPNLPRVLPAVAPEKAYRDYLEHQPPEGLAYLKQQFGSFFDTYWTF